MSDVLEKICADTRSAVAQRKAKISEAELSDLAAAQMVEMQSMLQGTQV